MSTVDHNNNNTSTSAACGTGGDDLKTCNGCKLVKYCDASCQKGHWSNQKNECKKRAAELHEEALFEQPPSRDECDVCMLTLPINAKEQRYQACCGKLLCLGCLDAAFSADDRRLCPFCRTPEAASDGETVERIKKRADCGDADAIHQLAYKYHRGTTGMQQDNDKAMELWLRAGELGCLEAYGSIADSCLNGEGVARDMKKAKHYYELAAMGGQIDARHNLGVLEAQAGNLERAMKHYMIAAAAGCDDSLKVVRAAFMNRLATKDDFEEALRAHKEASDEVKSDQREAAAAFYGCN